MEVKTIVNKQTNEPYKTKDGYELQEFKLEVGDVFIPQMNGFVENKTETEEETIVTHKILARVKNSKDEIVVNNRGEKEVWITLSPNQHKTLNNFIKGIRKNKDKQEEKVEPLEITQHLFTTYSYDSDTRKNNVGVTIKRDFNKPKDFEDFKEEEEEN